MSTTNYGAQTLLFDYRNPATSTSFNQILYRLLPAGIYEGGLLTKVDNSRVSVSPLECYITDEDLEIGVKITTRESAIIAVDIDTPYIVLRMEWREVPNNYMDIEASSLGDIEEGDLVLGKVEYTSNTFFLEEFDYTLRDEVDINQVYSEYPFRVLPTDPPSEFILINEGSIATKNGLVTGSLIITDPLSNTLDGRIDIIYIDETGAAQILEGVDSEFPNPPNYEGRYVIAEIHRGAGRDTIRGSEIIQINPDARIGLLGGGSGGLDWQESVLDFIDLTTDEPSSEVGDRYINTATGTSSASGQEVTEDYIYEWNGTSWSEAIPNEGTTTQVESESKIYLYDGSSWGLFDISIDHNNVSNIQGGNLTERYHLDQNQHTILTTNYTVTWEDTVTYSANEIVEYNGVIYRALGSSTNHDPVSYLGTDWEEYPHNDFGAKQGGTSGEYYHLTNVEHGILTSNYTISWESAVTYSADEIVEYNGVLYQALQANSNHDPETYIGVDWQKLTLGAVDWQASVLDRLDLTTAEPSGPSLEERYLSTTSGTSSATAQSVTEDYIYEWNGSSWDEVIPDEGTTVYVEDEQKFYVFDDSTWAPLEDFINASLDHNTLSGLQGGDSGEYYHLKQTKYNSLSDDNSYPAGWNEYEFYEEGDIVEREGSLYIKNSFSIGSANDPLYSEAWDKFLSSEHDWQDSVLSIVDFTTNEPASLSTGDKYINTTTGTSSDTSLSVTADYIYEWNGYRWLEIIPNAGTTAYVEDENKFYTFDDSAWVYLDSYVDHNEVSNLQGGNGSDEYYHLNATDYNAYTNSYSIGWNEYTTYSEGNTVEYDGILYKALQANTNHDPVTYIDVDWEELSLGGGAISEHTAGEDVTSNEVIALNTSGEAIVASKSDEAKIEVVGIAIESATTGNTFDVQKAGLVEGFTGLTAGLPCFLGDNGAIIQDDDDVAVGEYRVYLGIAKSSTIIDMNLMEATYNASNSTTGAESGASATTDYLAAETITTSQVVAVNSLGRAIVADKRYSDHVSVVGFATEDVTTDQTLTVLKLGQIDGLSGLTPGLVAYLGDNGAVTDNDEDIAYDEYRVSLGIVKDTDTVDVNIGEAGLNQLQEELAIRAFIGQVHGGGIYDAGTDELALRPISLHINDGLQDWWVEINEETDLSALANYPSTASDSNWFFVLIDRYGNVTLEDSGESDLTARPTNAFYQWGEYGGTGYDHTRKGYYHSSYSGKKIVGAFAYDLSETVWYVIEQGSEIEESGNNINGKWLIYGNGEAEVFYQDTRDISFSSTYGNQYRSTGGAHDINLPITFASVLEFSGSFLKDDSTVGPHSIITRTGWFTTSSVGLLFISSASGTSSNAIFSYRVKGKWHE